MQHMDSGMDVLMTTHSLYHSTLQGDWDEALTIYKSNVSIIHDKPINSSGDTVLHVAVNDHREDMVEKLVMEITRSGSLSALKTQNDRGDTPLHLAASRGSLETCKCIAEAQGDTQLIKARNKEGETPLFLAALHDQKDAFLYLHSRCPDPTSGLWKRSRDGETILHCTIRREHFGLAFEIIHLYGRHVVGSVDEKGITPLHILADKPSAFESSSNFRWYNKLVYNCICVKSLRRLEQHPKTDPLLRIKSSGRQRTQAGADAENPTYDGYENVPPNYWTCFDIFARAFTFVILPVVGTLRFRELKDLKIKKQKHVWCREILGRLWEHKDVAYVGGGSALQSYSLHHGTTKGEPPFPRPSGQIVDKQDKKNEETKIVDVDENKLKELRELLTSLCKGKTSGSESKALTGCCICLGDGEKKEEWDRKESALFIAAKNGVLEILEKILKDKPGAIHETNSKDQNVLHIAVEYRQPCVFKLLKQQKLWDNLVQSIYHEGNTILPLAARLSQYKPWHIPGSALQMQWEIKWFLYVKDIMPTYVSFLRNKGHKTPVEIFREDHEHLIKEGTEWLNHTSESCSVVAALIAGVAFATSTTIPGGTQEETGKPNLERHPAFDMFALTSLLALCCSITSLIMFLAILTSRHQPRDFRKDLPLKLLLGLSSLFLSIASMLVSFSAAFFFVLKVNRKQVIFPLYAATVLPVTFYAMAQFPLYADLVRAIFSKDPQSSNRESEKLIL